jgi:hypothetical protein
VERESAPQALKRKHIFRYLTARVKLGPFPNLRGCFSRSPNVTLDHDCGVFSSAFHLALTLLP